MKNLSSWGADPVVTASALYERIMRSLRYEVQQLEENELFEQTLLRGSQAALEQQPVSHDIDTLMRGMMGPTASTGYSRSNNRTNPHITNGPWNNNGNAFHLNFAEEGGGIDLTHGSGTTTGTRSVKGKSRGRKG